jgi:hypothetical protein
MSKEHIPTCISCGKALEAHDGLTLTCRKVRLLRNALRDLMGVTRDESNALDAARKALEETK